MYRLKLFLLAVVIISLNSCLSIKSSIVLNRDNSGTISFSYKVDNSLSALSEQSSYETPLNLDREYLDALANENSGIELIEYLTREDDEFIYYDALLGFSSIEDLNRILPSTSGVVIRRNGDSTQLTQTIAPESESLDGDSLELFKDIFKNHSVELTIKTPEEIVSINNGVRKDSREAIYQNSIIDILETTDKIDWSVNW